MYEMVVLGLTIYLLLSLKRTEASVTLSPTNSSCFKIPHSTSKTTMKRSPLKRKSFMNAGGSMKRTPLKPVSKKRRGELSVYSKLRRGFLAIIPNCQICGSKASDIHHRNGRFKERLNDQDYWLAVCRPCHDNIHHNPAWAMEKGYLIQR